MTTTPRIIVAAIAVVGIAAGLYTCTDRPSDSIASADVEAKGAARPTGVSARPIDSPIDLRERDRQRELDQDSPTDAPRERGADDRADARTQPASPTESDRQQPSERPEPVVAPSLPPDADEVRAQIKTDVTKALAGARDQMKRECWDGIDRGGVSDASVELGVSISFNAEGKAVTSSISQDRSKTIQGLDRCLAPFARKIEVAAPGKSVAVNVAFDFP